MNRPENTNKITKICVYCGSGPGTDPAFVAAATALGTAMAQSGIGLVYGGGGEGMMGAVARAVLEHGGAVTGIIPEFLTRREHALSGAQEMIVTTDMHERKRLMFEMADAFVAMPGGVGTLEELVEQLTWAQLGRHKKPILIANIKNFWQPLRALLDHMTALNFIRPGMDFELLSADRVEDIIPILQKAAESVPDTAKAIPTAVADRL
ncbi:MAG: Rossman fold protein, TIGR00730 family [Bradyrhizobium sp. 35-63-5]|nr:MAG: Rossman fold protein, TIGR00730 family [Bradyrhizobium sp. 35-63-5]